MAFLDFKPKADLETGLVIGAALLLAPVVLPIIAAAAKPVLKAAVKGALTVYKRAGKWLPNAWKRPRISLKRPSPRWKPNWRPPKSRVTRIVRSGACVPRLIKRGLQKAAGLPDRQRPTTADSSHTARHGCVFERERLPRGIGH